MMTTAILLGAALVGILPSGSARGGSIWAKHSTPLVSCENPAALGTRRLVSPDRAVVVEVECEPNSAKVRLRVILGAHTHDVQLRERSSELLWAPDSRAFLVNGGESAYAGFYVELFTVSSDGLQRHSIDRAVQRAMVAHFRPCQAVNASAECRAIEADPEFNASGIAWTRRSAAIVIVAEVPCSSLYGGIMCQVRGYEVQVPSGNILREMSAPQLKRDWQADMGWEMRVPGPPQYVDRRQ